MSITYNTGIPNPPNDPSVDAPNMQTNTNSVNAWVQVDHIGFNTSGSPSGQHKQVTVQGNNVPASQPPPATSVLYTNAGTADASHPQLFWENFNSWSGGGPSLTAPFHISAIRAWGYVIDSGAGPTATIAMGSNVTSVGVSGFTYTITLTSGAVSSSTFAVLFSGTFAPTQANNIVAGEYINLGFSGGVGTFQLVFAAINNNVKARVSSFTFAVLQI